MNVLIVDNQKGLKRLYRKAFSSDFYRLISTDDIESVLTDVTIYQPDLILLNVDADCTFNTWDLLLDIKTQAPSLPVLLLVDPNKGLFDTRLSKADGYVINDCFVAEDLRYKTAQVINREVTA